jgi:alpha-glucosidase
MPIPEDHAPWWRGATLYQVYPRSFADGDGDGLGDLPGLVERLPYIASLGVDGLWLGPVFPSPMRDGGYDVADFTGIHPAFGTLADFDRLVTRAHALGLKLVIDQVWSHTAAEHPWFESSSSGRDGPHADWYVWADPRPDGTPPNNWLSWMGGPAWRWEPRRRQYHLHQFLPQMPDLNLHHPAVQEAVLGVARFWLERGVDGFRLDAANLYCHDLALRDNPPAAGPADLPVLMQQHRFNADQPETLAFLQRLRGLLDELGGQRFTVAEIGGAEPMATMVDYTAGDARLHSAYSFALLGARPDAATLTAHMAAWQQGRAADGWPCWAFSNHDAPRVATRWGGGAATGFSFGGHDGAAAAATDAAASPGLWLALLMSLRGTLCLYQGEELGLPQAELPAAARRDPFGTAQGLPGRDGCRTPMPWRHDALHAGFGSSAAEPWLPVPDAHRALAVDLQHADPGSSLNRTRALLALRRRHAALRLGRFDTLHADGSALLALREHRGEQVLLAFNWGDTPVTLAPPAGHDAADGPGFRLGPVEWHGTVLRLGPASALIQPLARP